MIVVLAHFAAAFFPYSVFGSAHNIQPHAPWEIYFVTTPLSILLAGHFAVCVFFVLSGYVLSLPYFGTAAKDENSLKAAVVKRPIRLCGLTIVTILGSIVLSYFGFYFNGAASEISGSIPWLSQYYSQPVPDLLHLVRDLLTRLFTVGHLFNPPLWTIELELYGSFLTYAFVLLFRTSRLRYLAYATAIVLLQNTLYHGFMFGILIADIEKSFPNFWTRCCRPLVSLPILVAGILFASVPHYIGEQDLVSSIYAIFPRLAFIGGGYAMLGATGIFMGTLLNARIQKLLSGPVFAYIGRISFAIYAVHFLVLCSVSSWLFIQFHQRLNYTFSSILVAAAYIPCTLLIAHWLTIYVDEPTTRFANKIAKLYLSTLNRTGRTTQPDDPVLLHSDLSSTETDECSSKPVQN